MSDGGPVREVDRPHKRLDLQLSSDLAPDDAVGAASLLVYENDVAFADVLERRHLRLDSGRAVETHDGEARASEQLGVVAVRAVGVRCPGHVVEPHAPSVELQSE